MRVTLHTGENHRKRCGARARQNSAKRAEPLINVSYLRSTKTMGDQLWGQVPLQSMLTQTLGEGAHPPSCTTRCPFLMPATPKRSSMGFPSPLNLQATMILFTLLHQHTTGGRGRSAVVTGAARPAEVPPPATWQLALYQHVRNCAFSCSPRHPLKNPGRFK